MSPGSGEPDREPDRDRQFIITLADPDQLARNLALKLLTYATGTAPSGPDRFEMEDLVIRSRATHYGLRSMIHEVVQSKAFRNQ